MVTLRLTNRFAYTLIGLFLVVITSLLVLAYGSGDPSYMGHTADEIDGLPSAVSSTSCHWEKSWKNYPVEGPDIPEKTSCDVGNCIMKNDNVCNFSLPSCTQNENLKGCGDTSGGNDEWLLCC